MCRVPVGGFKEPGIIRYCDYCRAFVGLCNFFALGSLAWYGGTLGWSLDDESRHKRLEGRIYKDEGATHHVSQPVFVNFFVFAKVVYRLFRGSKQLAMIYWSEKLLLRDPTLLTANVEEGIGL